MRSFLRSIACVLAAAPAVAQDAVPGLHLKMSIADEMPQQFDDRVARTIALYVGEREPASPFLSRDQFQAEWRGTMTIEQRDRFRFTFQGIGHFALAIDGEEVLQARNASGQPVTSESIRLRKGAHAIVATFHSIRGKPAQVQLFWEGRKFGREPLPPTVFSHDPTDASLRLGEQLRDGRMLVATRRCTACHDAEVNHPLPMPELRMKGPELNGVGRRLDPGWIASWLRDPRAHRADARMPRVLHGDDETVAREAADLAAFLATHTRGPKWGLAPAGDASIGAYLFSDLGCIACHQIADEPEPDLEVQPVDLRRVGHKFREGALVEFLRDPRRHDESIRMPDFDLSHEEAAHLAKFLRQRTKGDALVTAGGDPDRGRTLFTARGCADCHALGSIEGASDAKPLRQAFANRTGGCLAETAAARGAAPDFGWSRDELAAVRAFGREAPGALYQAAAAEIVARQIEERRCTACHVLDGRTDDWTRRIGLLEALELEENDEDGGTHVAQHRPDLTWAGDKLRSDWLEEFFAGRVQERPRPWLHARMPTFPQFAEGLAIGLAAMHGHPPSMAEPEPVDGPLSKAGRTLLGAEAGFACVTCHGVGEAPPLAVFEVQGINLAQSGARLRRDFFLRWMLDPIRLDPSSRMPRYADDAGRTPFTEVLDGDARKQFAAIWEFVRSIQ